MRRLLIALALMSAAGPALADDTVLNRLVADYEAYALSQDPIGAGREGDRAALAKLPDPSNGADVLRRSNFEEFKGRLAAIDPAGLSPPARLNRDFLAWTLDRATGGNRPLTDIVIARCAMQVGAVLISPDKHFRDIPGLSVRQSLGG